MVITMAITASLNASSRPVLMAHATEHQRTGRSGDRWHPFPLWVRSAGWLARRAGDRSRSRMLFDRSVLGRTVDEVGGRLDLGKFEKYAPCRRTSSLSIVRRTGLASIIPLAGGAE